jgi:hypothetical protein
MFNPATAPSGGLHFLRLAEAAAPSLGIELNAFPFHDVAEIERVVAAVDGAGAMRHGWWPTTEIIKQNNWMHRSSVASGALDFVDVLVNPLLRML